jgi:hypothetical protein
MGKVWLLQGFKHINNRNSSRRIIRIESKYIGGVRVEAAKALEKFNG